MTQTIYLAGPIGGFAKCADWRKEAEQALENHNLIGLNPLRHKEQMLMNTSAMTELNDTIHALEKIIMRRDALDIEQSSGMIVCFQGAEKVSVGTCIEVGIAYALKKPIILVMDRGVGNPHDHAMVREAAWAIVNDIEEAVRLMASFLNK
jgi:nucleoside 2-deoxyribosyltransferase